MKMTTKTKREQVLLGKTKIAACFPSTFNSGDVCIQIVLPNNPDGTGNGIRLSYQDAGSLVGAIAQNIENDGLGTDADRNNRNAILAALQGKFWHKG